MILLKNFLVLVMLRFTLSCRYRIMYLLYFVEHLVEHNYCPKILRFPKIFMDTISRCILTFILLTRWCGVNDGNSCNHLANY